MIYICIFTGIFVEMVEKMFLNPILLLCFCKLTMQFTFGNLTLLAFVLRIRKAFGGAYCFRGP